MIPFFISINTLYLRIMYSLSENLKIWNPLGSKSVYLLFLWHDVLFICVFGKLFELFLLECMEVMQTSSERTCASFCYYWSWHCLLQSSLKPPGWCQNTGFPRPPGTGPRLELPTAVQLSAFALRETLHISFAYCSQLLTLLSAHSVVKGWGRG